MYSKSVDTVINACDAGREGESIFRLVYEKANCKKKMKRLWKEVLTNKYYIDIKVNKGMGVMLVNESGYYDILIKPMPNEEILVNQEMIGLAVNSKK